MIYHFWQILIDNRNHLAIGYLKGYKAGDEEVRD